MEPYQFFSLIGMFVALISMIGAGFAWVIFWLRSIDRHLNDLDKRLTIVETILAMMGMPIREKK